MRVASAASNGTALLSVAQPTNREEARLAWAVGVSPKAKACWPARLPVRRDVQTPTAVGRGCV